MLHNREAALDIVQVLHDRHIPLSMAGMVFEDALALARENTVPYSPKDMEERGKDD